MSKFMIHPDADIPAMLKDKGYSSYAIRRDHVLGESTMQKFRKGKLPSWAELAKLVENRYKGVKFNGKYGPTSAFLFEVKYKAEVSKDDTPNELVGKDVAYSKCLERAYKTAAGIAKLFSMALQEQINNNENVIGFLNVGAERENNWRKGI